MSTIDVGIKVDADSRAAVHGLQPLETALKDIEETSKDAEDALQELGDRHKVNIDDDEIKDVKDEIDRLRRQMRDELRIDINADTRDAQRRIRQLQGVLRILDTKDVNVDVDVDLPEVSLIGRAGLIGATMGTVMGTAAGAAFSPSFIASAALGAAALTGAALTVVGAGAGIAALAALKLSDSMAQAKIAFTQFLGSAPKANKFLGDLQKFAAKTPFEFPELVESSKTLLAFGIGSEDVIDIMTTLGDAAALTGGEVTNLTDIWGQMVAKGKVGNDELLQLTTNGIPAYQMLADAMGKTPGEIQKMAEKGELLSTTTLPILKKQMDNAFGGGMAKQAETLGGKFSTLKDSLAGFGTAVGEALTPVADALLKEIQPALENLTQWAKENKGTIAETLMNGIASLLDGFGFVVYSAGEIVTAIGYIADAIGVVVSGMGIWLEDLGKVMQAIQGLPGVPDDFGDSVVTAGQDMQDFGDNMGEGLKQTGEDMKSFADGVYEAADKVRAKGHEMAEGFEPGEIGSKIDRIQAHIDKLKKKPPSPKIDANIKQAEERIARLKKKRDDLVKGQHAVTIQAKIDKAKGKIDEIKDSLRYLRKQKPTPEVRADIKHWKTRLGVVKGDLKDLREKKTDATITPKTDKGEKDKSGKELNETANPGGKAREAKINAQVDPTTAGTARTVLDGLVGRRDAYIYVHTVSVGGGGGQGGGGGGGGGGARGFAPPAPDATGTLLVAGRTLAAPRGSTTTGVNPYDPATPGKATSTGTHVQLLPRQTPVIVMLDGEEIASHLDLKARRMASVTSVRRRA